MPAVRMIAFEKATPEYWFVRTVLSGKPSKSITMVLAIIGATEKDSNWTAALN